MKKVLSCIFAFLLLLITPIQAFASESNTDTANYAFDSNSTVQVLYQHLLENNNDLSEADAMNIALQLITKTEEIIRSGDIQNGSATYSLGQVVDGTLAENYTNSRASIPPYTSIISHGWATTPSQVDQDIQYTKSAWAYADNYNGSIPVEKNYHASLTISETETYSGSLTAAQAIEFGLTVTNTKTHTFEFKNDTKVSIPAWTKWGVRLSIEMEVRKYSGIYGYHCFNADTNEYFYMTEERTGINKKYISGGEQYGTIVNHSRVITNPTPPLS